MKSLSQVYIIVSFQNLFFFNLAFMFTILHGSRRAVKTGKGLGAFIMGIVSGRCKIDMGVGTQLHIAHKFIRLSTPPPITTPDVCLVKVA